MSARLTACFAALKAEKRAGLVAYLMAGDPDHATSLAIMDTAIQAGADILEIGFPFTDPSADGPSIQRAGERALAAGAGLPAALDIAAAVRARHPDTPLILMGYTNPVECLGAEVFAARAAKAGLDGVILVDLPPEEDGPVRAALAAQGLAMIRLATPTTDGARLARILDGAAGFLYYVSVAGVTGARAAAPEAAKAALQAVRAQTHLPIALGFGVRTPEAAAQFAGFADGVVVGSALVDAVVDGPPETAANRVGMLVGALAHAVKTARQGETGEI